MDCDDVMLLLAGGDATLPPDQASALDEHVSDCEGCAELISSRSRDTPWSGVGSYQLPIVDPTRFDLHNVIATGGMGKITRAFDHHLAREVAIKEVLSPDFRARFEREAAITARLQHPAIVPIYEAGSWPNGSAFYTMRLINGGTLADAIARTTTLAQRLELVTDVVAVTDALAYAHSHAIIHRDLKPSNVLVGEFGETVVIDWGLAKELGTSAAEPAAAGSTNPHVTTAGVVVGTPCFMPPEQARGDEIDERADVFALGALLYNVLAGSPPYWDQSHDTKELIAAVQARAPTPIRTLVPDAPADLCAIVERAMARDLVVRYPNAGVMAAELERFQTGQLLASREYRIRELLARWIGRHRTVVASTLVATAVLAVGATIALRKITHANEVADRAFERGQRKLCASEAPTLASPWDARSRTLVRNAFEATKLPYVAETLDRVDANLTRWSTELDVSRELVCQPTVPRDQLASELDCLADRAREARALINQFDGADPVTVLDAVAATEQLAPASRCIDASKPRVAPPASAALDKVHALFAQSHALMALGKFHDALPFATEAVAAADAIGDLGLRSDALVTLGAAQTESSDLDAAATTLQLALELSDVAQEDRLRAQAWNNIVRTEYLRGHFDQVVAMRAPALGAMERIGDLKLQTDTKLNIGAALGQLGKPAESQKLFEDVVAERRALYGDHDYRLGTALSALGNAYSMQGNLEKGIAAHREAVATVEAALGATHPTTGVMRGNLGDDYIYGLRPEEAIVELAKDVKILEAVDPKQRKLANALTDLGTAQLEAGHVEAALQTFERAEVLWLDVAPKHPTHGEALLGRYLALRAQNKPGNVADLEAALGLAGHLPPFERARIQLALGAASTGARARELVQAAATGFATSPLPLCQRELAVANTWLAAHPR